MRTPLLTAALLLATGCGDGPVPDKTATVDVRVVDVDTLASELPRVLGRGALVNVWAMW